MRRKIKLKGNFYETENPILTMDNDYKWHAYPITPKGNKVQKYWELSKGKEYLGVATQDLIPWDKTLFDLNYLSCNPRNLISEFGYGHHIIDIDKLLMKKWKIMNRVIRRKEYYEKVIDWGRMTLSSLRKPS